MRIRTMLPRNNWRNALALLHDLAASAAAWMLAYLFRLNFEIVEPFANAMATNLLWVVPLQAMIFLRLRMYRGLWRYASLHDLRRIVLAASLGSLVVAEVLFILKL